MRRPARLPQKIAIASNPDLPDAAQEARRIYQTLTQKYGLTSVTCAQLFNEELDTCIQEGEFDLLISLGGDGTMLRAGRLCAPSDTPVLGINLGHFGFLMEVQGNDWEEYLPMLLEGSFQIEERMMLRAEHYRDNELIGTWPVLNEIVVCRGKEIRPIRLDAYVDDQPLTTYIADGLIAATPTGSTAYALAAGGPILPPELRNILVIPVAPHLSVDRAIILSEGACITFTVQSSYETLLSADGQPSVVMQKGDTVRASTWNHNASFIRFKDAGYFYRNLTMYMDQNPTTGTKND